jgi:outer membrane protein
MNKRILAVFSTLIVVGLSLQMAWAQAKQNVDIGIVIDGVIEGAAENLAILKGELSSLLGSKYNVRIAADNVLNAGWSADNALAYYKQLQRNRNVDMIFGFGIITSTVIATEKAYTKPVILLGLLNPEVQSGVSSTQKSSQVKNLNYILVNRSIERDIDTFYSIYPYTKIGIVFFGEFLKTAPISDAGLRATMAQNNTTYKTLPIDRGIDDVLNNLDDIDAVYLGQLGKFEGAKKIELIEELNSRRIPTFGFSVKDAANGALAAMTPAENLPKIFRRMALNLEAYLEGKELANLPVHLDFEEKLTINMATAQKVNVSPDFTILTQATLLNEFVDKNARMRNLKDVLLEAVERNLDLKVQALAVKSSEKDVSLAWSNYLPTVTAGATGVVVDKDRAESSFGSVAERTLSGSASLQQVILSEQAIANVTIQKHRLEASEQSREQIKLDIMLEAGESYINILSAQSYVKLRQENLNRIRKNLDIARQREVIGYSSRSDVYRWESELATETGELIEAKNNLRLTKIQLNRLLHHPLDENFNVTETVVENSEWNTYADFKKYVRNQRLMQQLSRILIDEALRNSTEIKQIDASIAALQRSRQSIQRQRFVPVLGLAAELEHTFAREGAGTNAIGPTGQPLEEPEDTRWNVGVSASLPLFKGGEIWHQSEQTQIEIRKLEQQKANLMQSLEANVRAKVLDLGLSVANLDLAKRSAEFAVKSFDMVQDAYSKGSVSIVELTDAQTNALNAELAAINSEYNYHANLLRTQRAMSHFLITKSDDDARRFSQQIMDALGK